MLVSAYILMNFERTLLILRETVRDDETSLATADNDVVVSCGTEFGLCDLTGVKLAETNGRAELHEGEKCGECGGRGSEHSVWF